MRKIILLSILFLTSCSMPSPCEPVKPSKYKDGDSVLIEINNCKTHVTYTNWNENRCQWVYTVLNCNGVRESYFEYELKEPS